MIKKEHWGPGPLTEITIDLNKTPITEPACLELKFTENPERFVGLQDAVEGARTPQELRLQLDWGYNSVYDHEADLPIVCPWLENIPEWAFYMEVVRRYVDCRYNRIPRDEVNDQIPDEASEKLQDALMEYFKCAHEIAYRINPEPFSPEGLR